MDQSRLSPQLRAVHVLRDNDRFGELFALAFDADPVVRVQALAEIDEVTRARPDLVVPRRGELLDALERIDEGDAQRFVAMILSRIKLAPKERAKAAPVFERWLESPSAAAVMAALAVLVDFAAEDGRFRRGFVPRVERRMREWTPALRTRAQRVLARLTPKAPVR